SRTGPRRLGWMTASTAATSEVKPAPRTAPEGPTTMVKGPAGVSTVVLLFMPLLVIACAVSAGVSAGGPGGARERGERAGGPAAVRRLAPREPHHRHCRPA